MTIEVPSSAIPLVSVIIPTKTIDLALCALRSLARWAPTGVAFETIVVINGATGELAVELERRVTGIRIVTSIVNRGLAGACNLGRTVASGQLLVLLHDDAEIEPGWLEALVAATEECPEAGAIGSKVLFPDGTLQTAGAVLWRDATTSPPWIGDAPSADAFGEPRAVDYCGSSSILVRAEVWDSIGGLDERFFPAYFVDVDLAMSVRDAGWMVLYEPRSRIRHRQGTSTTLRFRTFVAQRNRALFTEKWCDVLAEQPVNDGDVSAAVHWAAVRPLKPKGTSDAPILVEARDDSTYLEMARVLQDEYVRHLTQSLDRTEAELSRLATSVADAEMELDRLRAASRYFLDTRLEFRIGGLARHFQSHGGYPPEDWGQWLGNSSFVITLPLDVDDDRGRARSKLKVELEAVSYLDESRTVSPITLSVNGQLLVDVAETRCGVQHYTATLPSTAYDAGRLVVRIASSAAARPSGGFGPPDERSLSVGLVALTVGSG